MAWFLALQGPPNKVGQSLTYELHESADVEQLSQELAGATSTDRPVAVPAVFGNQRQLVTLYVRPTAWGVWAFYEMTEDERREMIAANPLINAVAQAAKKQQQQRMPQGPAGPSVIPRLGPN